MTRSTWRTSSAAACPCSRGSGKADGSLAGAGEIYEVKVFSHGLTLPDAGRLRGNQDAIRRRAARRRCPRALPNAIPRAAPGRARGSICGRSGVQGRRRDRRDGRHPKGHRRASGALRSVRQLRRQRHVQAASRQRADRAPSRPDAVRSARPHARVPGPGAPVPLLEAPRGGDNVVTGIGLYTNGINSRAWAALWMAGADSLMDDVRFLGGHGTNGLDGRRVSPYSTNLSTDPDPHRRWDSQYPSLWITHGGGGTFANIWTPSTFAQAGLYISDTSTPGRVYELSCEHHVRTEIKLDQVANWELYALQTEGEREESASASSLDISRSHNITIANYHGYRVVRSYHPFPYADRACTIRATSASATCTWTTTAPPPSATRRAAGRSRARARSPTRTASWTRAFTPRCGTANSPGWMPRHRRSAAARRARAGRGSRRGKAYRRVLQSRRRGRGRRRTPVFRGFALAPHLPLDARNQRPAPSFATTLWSR